MASNKQKSKHGLTFTTSKMPIEKADPVSRKILMKGRTNNKGAPLTASAPGLTAGVVPNYDGANRDVSGTSIFDPVLCELAYRWFCPPEGNVLDPFAGGSVRGIVAAKLGRRYLGVDLRKEQVAANRRQAQLICEKPRPLWLVGDSANLAAAVKDEFDFIFSCPPYGDLERYSDNPLDLSTMEYADFIAAYRKIIAASCSLLKDNRFACFVVGDIRDQDDRGVYRAFHMDTIAAFRDAGLDLYNHAILVTAVGTLPVRMGRGFESARKLGKTHQDVLLFVKGDPRKATEAIGPVEFGEPAEFTAEPNQPSYGERVTAEQLGGEV